MRKITLLLCALAFNVLAFAQTTRTGTVRDEKGEPIPFATVTVVGTNTSVRADANGAFNIKAAEGAQLRITATGHQEQTVTVSGTTINATLNTSQAQLKEVVVTALGVRRKPEEIGYATSSVRPDQITAGRQFNLAQSLSGKVAGLSIVNTSAAVNATPRIVLRGIRSLTGNNQALIVLDGVQVPSSTINFINPNDVERVDVLKGGQAATLFGSEGVNGAIVITTKRGTGRPEVTFSHTSNVEQVSMMPKFQTQFGSGSAYGANQRENFEPIENQQYGDRYDGSLRPLGRRLADGSQLLVPYNYNPNARMDFWNTGYTTQNDLSYRSGDANSAFFFSYQNLYSSGVVPGDKYNRNVLRINSSRRYNVLNLSFDATYTWDNADRTNADYYFFALNTAAWVPVKQFRNWQSDKFAGMSNYYNDYYNNPFWLKDNVRFQTRNQVLSANIKGDVKATSWLTVTGRFSVTQSNANTTTPSSPYTFTNYAQTTAFTDYFNLFYDRYLTGFGRFVSRTPVPGSLGESQSNNTRLQADLFANVNQNFGLISLNAIVGAQGISTRAKSIAASTASLGVPGLYNLNNSATGLYVGSNSLAETRKVGGFVDVTVGYKGYLYGHASVRQDYTSLFSAEQFGFKNPRFTTYGGDLSLIVTDAVPSLKGQIVDYVKLRGSYNQNGNDNVAAYGLTTIYPNASGFPYSGLLGTTVGNTNVDPGLRPEIVKTAELGFELGFLKNRFSLEGSVYTQSSQRQILDVNISSATGYFVYRLNAADLTNRGFELEGRANVINQRNLNVTFTANYSYINNKVNNLYGGTGLSSLEFQAPDERASVTATVGQMFPTLRVTAFQRDAQGRVIVDQNDGWPLRADQRVIQGTTLPTNNLGIGVNVKWKSFTLIANAEYRAGNVIYHDIGTDMAFTGSGAISAIYGREQFIWPNSVHDDGTGKLVPNTNVAVDQYKALYQGYGDAGFSRGLSGIGEMFVSSGAFWKLREISLGYQLPNSLFGKGKVIKGVSLTGFGRNLLVFLPKDNWYTDPEFSNTNGNSTGINNTFNTPPVRQYGATLRATF